MLIRGLLAALILGGVFAGAAVAQEDVPVPRDAPYVQSATGMSFPPAVGDFRRGRVTRYAPDGTDESAGYGRIIANGEIIATVYVYPSPALSGPATAEAQRAGCAQQFDAVLRELEGVYADESLVSQGETHLSQGGAERAGMGAVYTLTAPRFMGRENERLRSETHLFCYVGGRWSVKYRISYPENYNASAAIAAFMRDLTWTIRDGAI